MDRRIRYLALFVIACFGLLFLQLNNLQVRQASSLANSQYTPPSGVTDPYTQPRGEIVSADGVVLARSVPTNDIYGELREYPTKKLFADITGYYDVVDTAPYGLEAEYDNYLSYHQDVAHTLRQLLTVQSGTDTVVITVSDHLQTVAQQALGSFSGAVIALNTQTGAVLAMYGNPTYDPNLLSSHDPKLVKASYTSLADAADPGASPLISYATGQTIQPGSTFKVVTTSAIYDHDPSVATQSWPVVPSIKLPDTDKTLQNFGRELCGGPLAVVLAKSCDTSYAQIGLSLGARNLSEEAAAFGFDTRPPIDLPPSEVAEAVFPPVSTFSQNLPAVAYSAIGQYDDTETALQNALIAAGIANGGAIMTPHLLAHVVDQRGNLVTSYHPSVWRQATSSATAATVRQLMLGVTESGTASGIFPTNLNVAAKTGTAETGATGCSADWMIALAPAGANQTPTVAVAAVLPFQPGLSCSETGAEAAGPVVKTVLEAALAATP